MFDWLNVTEAEHDRVKKQYSTPYVQPDVKAVEEVKLNITEPVISLIRSLDEDFDSWDYDFSERLFPSSTLKHTKFGLELKFSWECPCSLEQLKMRMVLRNCSWMTPDEAALVCSAIQRWEYCRKDREQAVQRQKFMVLANASAN